MEEKKRELGFKNKTVISLSFWFNKIKMFIKIYNVLILVVFIGIANGKSLIFIFRIKLIASEETNGFLFYNKNKLN